MSQYANQIMNIQKVIFFFFELALERDVDSEAGAKAKRYQTRFVL